MNHLDFQREYWDGAGREKEFTLVPRLGGLAGFLTPEARVLDYGCGYGRVAAELVERGFGHAVGVDASTELVARGLRRHPGLDLRAIDGLPLPFDDASFDAVLLVAVLTCIPMSGGQASLMAELARVLKPGGLIYIADFLLNEDQRNLARYDRYAARYDAYGVFELEEGAVLRHHDPAYIDGLLARFETIVHEQAVTKTMNGHKSKAFHFLGRKPVA